MEISVDATGEVGAPLSENPGYTVQQDLPTRRAELLE